MIVFSLPHGNEREKFEYIYGRYKPLLMHKAHQIVRDRMLAEDAVSEAFIRIYKNLRKVGDPDSNQSVAFYITIVKNTSLTLLSKNPSSAELLDETTPDPFDLEEHILSNASCDAIYSALDTLNENLKNVFMLRYAYDLSHREIAGLLKVTENNVNVMVHRARKKLSEILAREGVAHEQ